MKHNIYFITGTNTGVGKTTYSSYLLDKWKSNRINAAALKPIASGCEVINGVLVNEDALILHKSLCENLDNKFRSLDWINPVRFKPPIAPHIAADMLNDGSKLTCENLMDIIWPRVIEWLDYANSLGDNSNLLIEGAGGWQVPLNHEQTYAHWVQAFKKKLQDYNKDINFGVVLVVGMQLGCLNHALLSANSIKQSGCDLSWWVANEIDPKMDCFNENFKTLEMTLGGNNCIYGYKEIEKLHSNL